MDEQLIPRSLIDAYGDALTMLEDESAATLSQAVAAWLESHPEIDWDELRSFATNAAYVASTELASQSAGLSDAMAEVITGTAPQVAASVTVEVDAKAVEGTVRRQINLVRAGKPGEFAEAIGRIPKSYGKRAARERALGNVDKNVRYQRVQQGESTCTFCQMLAARGPVYVSESRAGKFREFHKNCDCVVVPVPVGYKVEGFDAQAEYDRWQALAAIDADDKRYPTKEAKEAAKLDWVERHPSRSLFVD